MTVGRIGGALAASSVGQAKPPSPSLARPERSGRATLRFVCPRMMKAGACTPNHALTGRVSAHLKGQAGNRPSLYAALAGIHL